MKKIFVLSIILLLLSACNQSEILTVQYSQETEGGQSQTDIESNDLYSDNPIDISPEIQDLYAGNNSDMIKAANMRCEAWQWEMVNVNRHLHALTSTTQNRYMSNAQAGYQEYLNNSVQFNDLIYKEKYGTGSIVPLLEASNKAELYKQRAIELIEMYEDISGEEYTFAYPDKVDYEIDSSGNPVTQTREDFADMRQRFPYEQSIILDYEANDSSGYLDIDLTAGTIEDYLSNVLSVIKPGEEIDNIENQNDFVYRAAAFNTSYVRAYDPLLNSIPAMYPMMKEHLSETAKYLFGDECKIDYGALEDIRQFIYYDYYGIATLPSAGYLPVKAGHTPIVLDYVDNGDSYEVRIVYLFWNTMSPTMDAYYTDESYNKELLAKDECQTLTKYTVDILKGTDNKLLFRSCLLAD